MSKCPKCEKSMKEGQSVCENCGYTANITLSPIDPNAPMQNAPMQNAPMQNAPMQNAPMQNAPVQNAPMQNAPVQNAPMQNAPMQNAPMQNAPMQNAPMQNAPMQNAPVQNAPMQNAPMQNAPMQQPGQPPYGGPVVPPKKKISGKLIGLIAGGLAAVILLAVLLPIAFGGIFGAPETLFYFKDGEVMHSTPSKAKPKALTEDLTSGNDVEYLQWMASRISSMIQWSKDGKTILYPDNTADEGMSLYLRKLADEPSKATLLDTDITYYKTNSDMSAVYYLKTLAYGNTFHYHDLKTSVQIDTNVVQFDISDDGKTIVYLNDAGDLYRKTLKGEKTKVAANLDDFDYYVSDDLAYVYFIKNGDLFVKEKEKQEVKIDTEIGVVYGVLGNKAYYTRSSENTGTMLDFVEDDLAEQDAAMKKPVIPRLDEYDSITDWLDAYDKYFDDMAEYRKKEMRDEEREFLKEESASGLLSDFYCYDGSAPVLLAAQMTSMLHSNITEEVFLLAQLPEGAEISKIKFSEVEYGFEIFGLVQAALKEDSVFASSDGKKVQATDLKNVNYAYYDVGSSMVNLLKDSVILEEDENFSAGDLYKAKMSGGFVGTPEKVDSGATFWTVTSDAGIMYYFKNVLMHEFRGDMYSEGKLIAEDVEVLSTSFAENRKDLLYLSGQNGAYDYTLSLYDGDQSYTLAEKVAFFNVLSKGTIAYVTDYKEDAVAGDLYTCKATKAPKPVLIDYSVSAILTIWAGVGLEMYEEY